MSTLHAPAIPLLIIAIFETILGILRYCTFSRTTILIHVERGARLFDHLSALPISYFQARRCRYLVARVRATTP